MNKVAGIQGSNGYATALFENSSKINTIMTAHCSPTHISV
jgi:hypothetical protein